MGPKWRWNSFDFAITVVCWIPASVLGGRIDFIRLARLMRLLKLFRKFKQLQVIVKGLFQGLSSVKYILLLMLLIYSVYAIVGVWTFR